MRKFLIFITVLVFFSFAFFIGSQFISLFVIQPIGALPKGATLIVKRGQKMKFIDSADAMCERVMGGVNLLCRGMALGAVAENRIATLPYSEYLYLWSTGGVTYEK
jgi:hypothetical protein